jgi:hypothetical protein
MAIKWVEKKEKALLFIVGIFEFKSNESKLGLGNVSMTNTSC